MARRPRASATRFCPKCGSCAVVQADRSCACRQCGHEGRPASFTADAYRPPLAQWGGDPAGLRGTDPIRFERGLDEI